MRRLWLAPLAAAFVVIAAASSSATGSPVATRVAGTTRYGTARQATLQPAFGGATTAYVASGESYPDALAAASIGAPLLLTPAAALDAETAQGLDNLAAQGVRTAVLMGGTDALSENVETQVQQHGFTTRRVAGVDRYGTAAALSKAAAATATTAVIASGADFADALAAAPLAAGAHGPLLLTARDTLPSDTSDELQRRGIQNVLLVGGPSAVSDTVATQLAAGGRTVTRVQGVDRYATASAVANYEVDTIGYTATDAVITNGQTYPDALVGGSLASALRAPLLLVINDAPPPTPAFNFLEAHESTMARLYFFGGTAVISQGTMNEYTAAASSPVND